MGQADDLYNRTKMFAIRIVKLFQRLPKTEEARLIGRQLLRSGPSVPANYRAARRARSRAEFIAKLGAVVEETDESAFWLEFLVDTEILKEEDILVTFFTVGSALLDPTANFTEVYKELLERGHQVALHTHTHPRWVSYSERI